MTNRTEPPRAKTAATVAAVAMGVLPSVLPAGAAAQDLRYSITPTAQQVSWDDALGLDNTLLYGGRLGVVFGRRIELQGFYLTNQGTDGGIRDLYQRLNITDPPPQNPGLDVQNFGAAFVYNFALGGFTPFVRAGGSVLRFEPEGGERSDRIALSYGGGLRFGKPGGLRFNIFAEDLRFRIDPTLLLALPPGGGPPVVPPDVARNPNKLRSNLTYGAGLSVPLGGGAVTYDDTPQYQLGNVALPIDVFAGQQNFTGASGLPRQYVAGVRTGIDFGPLVGLRGFYWRGVSDNFRSTQGVQGYGGEAQFALNAGPGLNPYLIAGAGQVDFLDSYDRTVNGVPVPAPADQTALILGAGVKIPVGTRFTLTGAARNYLAALGGATQDAAEASQLRSNWQYNVGLSFGLGGRGLNRRTVARPGRDTVFVERGTNRRVRRDTLRETEVVRLRDDEQVVERFVVTARGDTLRGVDVDSALTADRGARLVEVRRAAAAREVRERAEGANGSGGYIGDRTVEVVVPTEGEIIVRYGPQRAPASVPGAAPYTSSLPPRAFQREYREGNRVIREYRESDGTTSREFLDDQGRAVREYREPSGRVVREYIPVSSGAGTVVVPRFGAPTTQYVPGTAPSTVTVVPGQPAPAPQYAPPQPAPSYGGQYAGPQYVPGYEPSGYVPPPAAAGPANVTAGTDAITKDRPGAPVPGAARVSRSPALEARINARIDSLERAVAAREAAAGRPVAGADPNDVRAIVREELARAERERAAAAPAPAPVPTTVVTQPGTPGVQVVNPQPAYYGGTGVQGGLLYSGATFTDATQGLLGFRLDFGPLAPGLRSLRLVPELAVGVGGGGTSTYVAANALYEIGPVFRVRPRLSLGAGLLNFSSPVGSRDGLDVVVTPAYGVSFPFRGVRRFGWGTTPELLVEHQGVGLFDLNRLVVGLGWRR